MSVLHTGQRAHPVSVEVMSWRQVRHKQCLHGVMAMSHITIRHTGQCVDCGEDWDVEATGCDQGSVFAAALLRAGRSRRRRGVTDVNAWVGPDASIGTSHDWLGPCIVVLARRAFHNDPCFWVLNRQHQQSHESSSSSAPQLFTPFSSVVT